MLQKSCVKRYPPSSDARSLANAFADFFAQKIDKIHADLHEKTTADPDLSSSESTGCQVELSDFAVLSQGTVKEYACKSAKKSYNLDPLPASLMKNCLDMLLPIMTNIVNLSLPTGTRPETLKVAELVPALKKHDADHEQFSNFRPISNLVMVSKVIEKAVSAELTDHVKTHHLEECFQSAYKIHHSTETALVKVHNNILRAIDDNRSVLLLLLDLPQLLTLDHFTLLLCLRTRFGMKGSALAWFESYLASRKYYVQVEGYKSSLRSLDFGVPQGSVLGPLLYMWYTSPVADIIKSHDLQYHLYADDTQLYITFKTDSADDACLAKSRVEHCVQEIDRWMISNKLKLNDDKTELFVFSSKFRPRPCLSNVQIGSECIEHSNTVRNLGVLCDQTLSFGEHVNKSCKSSHYHLTNISKIRKYLDENSTETLVHAFVSSKLDYCNAILIGLLKYQIDRLQSVLNTAARIITFTSKYELNNS